MKLLINLMIAMLLGASVTNAQCIEIGINIFSNTTSQGPTNVEWQVKNQSNVTVTSGGTSFNAETSSYFSTVCLEPGCYTLRIVGNGVSNPENFYGYPTQEGELLAPTSTLIYGTQVLEYPFCTGVQAEECVASFEYSTFPNEEGFVSFQNFSESTGNNVNYLWNFGDGTASEMMNPGHQYTMNGTYEVCLTATTIFEGFVVCQDEYCTIVIIDDFVNNNCPSSMYASGECGNWVFEVGNAQPGENVIWTFGNVVVDNAGHYIQHTFQESGVYEVCAQFESELCPEGVQICQMIEVDVCETAPCTIEIEAVYQGNNSYIFTAFGNPEVYPMLWSFGDGATLAATWVVEHTYTEPGVYEICGTVNSEMCAEPVTGCVEIVVEEQPACTNVVLTMDSYMAEGGASFFEYDFVNLGTSEVVSTGVAQYTTNDPFFDQMNCLQDGCYSLRICTGNTTINWNAVNVFFSEQAIVLGWLPYCNNGREYFISVNSECAPVEPVCALEEVSINVSGEYSSSELSDIIAVTLATDVPAYLSEWVINNETNISATLCVPADCYSIILDPVNETLVGTIHLEISVNGEEVINQNINAENIAAGLYQLPVGVECIESTQEITGHSLIQVYPNPSNGMVILEKASGSSKEQYQIFDLAGRSVMQGVLTQSKTQLDLLHLADGVYNLTVSGPSALQTIKIQVSK